MSQPFDEIRERLLRGGIAPRHVRRYLRELSDHFGDLVLEERRNGLSEIAAKTAARQRLGSDEALADALLSRPELRSIAARHPALTFGLGSIVILASAVFAATLSEVGFIKLVAHLAARKAPLDWLYAMAATWSGLVTYALPLLIVALLCRVVARQRMNARRMFLAACVVGFFGGLYNLSTQRDAHHASLNLSMVGPLYTEPMVIAALIHAATNLAIAGSLIWVWLRRTNYRIAA